MKITKYKVGSYVDGKLQHERLFETKERALVWVNRTSVYFEYKYEGEVEIELVCEGCEKELSVGDEYILVDGTDRYCSDCYQESTYTYYEVGGEHVGSEDEVESYDDFWKEVEEADNA